MTDASGALAIWWLRRDLRLGDNQALQAALDHAGRVLPVFIFDPRLLASPQASPRRTAFLIEGLRVLDQELRRRGSRLWTYHGDPLETLHGLLQRTGAQIICAEADHTPFARRRDEQIAARLPLILAGGPAAVTPGMLLKANGQPYTIFTPFSRAWKALPGITGLQTLPAPDFIPTPGIAEGEPLLSASPGILPLPIPAGEAAALERLQAFIEGLASPVYDYTGARNRMDLEGTSGLSPYLRFGMLSPRQAVAAAYQAVQHAPNAAAASSAETWLNELIWRDFYIHVLHYFPRALEGNFRPLRIDWLNDDSDFAAWRSGETGYPVVDAAMRQLASTGWMHNRARMITASFLTKDLLVDWRRGERWFMQHLLDGDPAANNGGWQWTAGTGTDAAPYFRIFNPLLQGMRFDPEGAYVRRWLPELQAVPAGFIHEPWKMPASLQARLGVRIGRDYPAPRIDHHFARQRALDAYHPQSAPHSETHG